MRLDGAARRGRGGAARHDRPPRARALRRLQRAVRPPVDVDRAARRRTLGDRAVVHPPPRPGARLRQAGARRARRTGALARGGRGRARWRWRRPAARGGRAHAAEQAESRGDAAGARARVGYLGPAGTFSEEALLRERRRRRGRAGRAGDASTTPSRRCATRRGRLGDRADRELARGLDQRHARPARRARPATCEIVGEALLRRAPLADRRRAGSSSRRSRRCSPIRRCPASARASCAASCAQRADPAGELDRRGGAHGGRASGDARDAPRSGTRARGRDLRRQVAARGRRGPRRQRNALRLARARGGERAEPPLRRARRPGAVEDLARVLGRRRRARPAGSCAASTSSRGATST